MKGRSYPIWRVRSPPESIERQGLAIPHPKSPKLCQIAQPHHEDIAGVLVHHRVQADCIQMIHVRYSNGVGWHYIPLLPDTIGTLLRVSYSQFPSCDDTPLFNNISRCFLRCGGFPNALHGRISGLYFLKPADRILKSIWNERESGNIRVRIAR
jgi:hypothetical protein